MPSLSVSKHWNRTDMLRLPLQRSVAIALLALAAIPVAALALNSVATGFQIGATPITVDAHGTCQKVSSADGNTYFVPTNTSTEWSAFRTNKPSGVTLATCDPTVIFLESGSAWTVPADWNSSNNTIEVIGGGGGGAGGNTTTSGDLSGGGGGGGAYSKITNVALTAGASVTYAIGVGGTGGVLSASGNPGGDTYFCSGVTSCTAITDSAVVVGAKGGVGGKASTGSSSSSGGQASAGVGTITYSGGTGVSGTNTLFSSYSGGGGGAGGPQGSGVSASTYNGGTGDNGYGGVGGGANADGNPGTEWDATHGSGGGGGGSKGNGSSRSYLSGHPGGAYGAGASGAIGKNNRGGAGAQGLIIITYWP